MRPLKLILENVGPFVGRAEIDFSRLGDIFLISGRTGSGKTTVFDSLCYALYGTLPGGRKGQTRRIRSDFAEENEDCSVSLEFELGERSFLVERKPPRLRKKARGEGFIEDPETALLFEKKGARMEALNGKKLEADEKIKQLIGLSFDEFSKIVILPQGEFAEFLKQNTSDRREVLKKLFPVDHAVRVRELAAERTKAGAARLSEAERALVEALARFSPEDYEKHRDEAEKAVAEANELTKALESKRDRLTDGLRAAEESVAAQARFAASIRREAELDERAEEIERMETRLRLCRLARPLAPLLARSSEAGNAARRSAEALVAAKTAQEDAERRFDEIDARKDDAAAAEKEAATLRERRGPLEEAAREEAECGEFREELEKLAERWKAASEERAGLEAAARKRSAEIAAARETAEKADEWDTRWEAARDAMERARALKGPAERCERLRSELEEVRAALAAAEAEIEERRSREPLLRAELEEIETLIRETERRGSAAELAAGLRNGAPCPVCGSTEHPAPAPAASPSFDLAAKREVRRRSLEDSTAALAARESDRKSMAARAERLEAERAEIAQEAGLAGAAVPSVEQAEKELAERAAALNDVVGPRTEARKARDRLAALYRESERQEETAARISETLSAVAARRAAVETSLSERQERLKRALESLGTHGSVAEALAAADRRIAEIAERLGRWKERRELAGNERATAAAAARAAATAAAEAAAAAESAQEAFASAIAGTPFGGAEDVSSALLDAEEERRLEREIPAWREERGRARMLREELEAAAGKRPDGDGDPALEAETLRAAVEENEAARAQAAERRDAAASVAQELERNRRTYEEAESRRAALSSENRLLKSLSDDLSGNNPKKRSFDAWLLGAYLAEVAAYATKRLERMSEGRYRLMLDDEKEGGRGQTGLDLAVFDSYTGRARPCSTLSGGESFMASISLALGLADSIQARSGGVRLDAVFIDEGFGSLDDASLDKALGILDEIRDHRMVGLISHVAEMKTRIPSRLEIVKTSTGSKAVQSASS